MSWFLVLLFWNPDVGAFQVADGWSPRPYETIQLCETRMDYVLGYLPNHTEGTGYVVDCVEALSQKEAIAKITKGQHT